MRKDLPKRVELPKKLWKKLRRLQRKGLKDESKQEEYRRLSLEFLGEVLPIFGEMAKAVKEAEEAEKLRATLNRLTNPDVHTD